MLGETIEQEEGGAWVEEKEPRGKMRRSGGCGIASGESEREAFLAVSFFLLLSADILFSFMALCLEHFPFATHYLTLTLLGIRVLLIT